MNVEELKAFATEMSVVVREVVADATAPLHGQIDSLKGRVEAWEQFYSTEDIDQPVIRGWVEAAVAAIPPPEPKELDLEPVRVIAQEIVETRLAAFPVPENGEKGEPGEPGKDGSDGKDGKDAVLPDLSILEYAPDEVAESIALAVKKMAEFSQTRIIEIAEKSIPVTLPSFNFTLADNREPPVVNIEQPAPVVNMAAPVVTVAAPQVHVDIPKRGREVTTVTGWDKAGRVTSFEKVEADE